MSRIKLTDREKKIIGIIFVKLSNMNQLNLSSERAALFTKKYLESVGVVAEESELVKLLVVSHEEVVKPMTEFMLENLSKLGGE